MIAGQLMAGLANVEHQEKILAEASTLITLQAKFERLVSLETTDQSTSHLHTAPPKPMISESAAQRSQYAQHKWVKKKAGPPFHVKAVGKHPTTREIYGSQRLPSPQH